MKLQIAILFIVVSIPIVYFSWPHFRNLRSHGFYRFFVFESDILLVLIQLQFWFADPFTIPQLLSWFLLATSLLLALHGFYLLRKVGEPNGQFEATTQLVTVGAYRYIRHPLYASLLFLAWGAFLKHPTWGIGLLVLINLLACIATAKVEEAECLEKFGAQYIAYMRSTKMFIPYLF
jgi:protein-S-isoprenylcysteine O-methyltransferase Ste14